MLLRRFSRATFALLLLGAAAPACGSADSSAPSRPAGTPCTDASACAADEGCDLGRGVCVKVSAPPSGGGAAGAPDADFSAGDVQANVACSVMPQSGCPDGHTCLVSNAAGDTSCYGAGTRPPGSLCSTVNDCALGLACIYGICRPLCGSASDCPAKALDQCNPILDRTGATLKGPGSCSTHCNPADPQNGAGDPAFIACPSVSTCLPTGMTSGATDCYSAPAASHPGEACGDDGCGPGYVCVDFGTSKSCATICLIGQSSCPGGQSCTGFDVPVYVGRNGVSIEMGVCG